MTINYPELITILPQDLTSPQYIFAEAFKAASQATGLTKSQLAERLGVTENTVYHYSTNTTSAITAKQLNKVLAAIGYKVITYMTETRWV